MIIWVEVQKIHERPVCLFVQGYCPENKSALHTSTKESRIRLCCNELDISHQSHTPNRSALHHGLVGPLGPLLWIDVDRYPAMCLLCFQNPASMDLESRKMGTHRYSAVTSSSLSGQLNFFVMSWKSSRLAWIFAWHSGKIVVHSPWNKVKALCNFCLRLRTYPCCKESPDISYRKANSLWSHSSNTVQVAWLLMNGVINY